MSEPDDLERDLRLELMRLDYKLKMNDLRRKDQQLAYEPVKLLLYVVGSMGALIASLLFLWFA
jgi:hypothetical protein